MDMFESISNVLANIGRCALFGFCVSLPFDLIEVWDKRKKPSPKALFAADAGYCVAVALAFFAMLLAFADGSLRLGWFISAALGALIYKYLMSRFLKKAFFLLFEYVEKVKACVMKFLFAPTRFFIEKICNILIKPLKFLLKHIKIVMIRLKAEKVRKKISGRKRKWRQEQNKVLKGKAGCRE